MTTRWLRVAVVRLHDVLHGGGGLERARSPTAADVWSPVTRVKSSTGADARRRCGRLHLADLLRRRRRRRPAARVDGELQRHLWTTATKLAAAQRAVDCVDHDVLHRSSDMTVERARAGRRAERQHVDLAQDVGATAPTPATWPAPARRSAWCPSSGGLSLRWNGSGWTTLPTVDYTNAFQGHDVACVSAASCLMVDVQLGRYSRWNGTSWSTTLVARVGLGLLAGVRQRVLVPRGRRPGRFTRFNGTSWASLATFDVTRGGTVDLSCGGVGSCLLTDHRGKAYRLSRTTWGGAVSISSGNDSAACELDVVPDRLTGPAPLAHSERHDVVRGELGRGVHARCLGEPDCPVSWMVRRLRHRRLSTFTGLSCSASMPSSQRRTSSGSTAVDCVARPSARRRRCRRATGRGGTGRSSRRPGTSRVGSVVERRRLVRVDDDVPCGRRGRLSRVASTGRHGMPWPSPSDLSLANTISPRVPVDHLLRNAAERRWSRPSTAPPGTVPRW